MGVSAKKVGGPMADAYAVIDGSTRHIAVSLHACA